MEKMTHTTAEEKRKVAVEVFKSKAKKPCHYISTLYNTQLNLSNILIAM